MKSETSLTPSNTSLSGIKFSILRSLNISFFFSAVMPHIYRLVVIFTTFVMTLLTKSIDWNPFILCNNTERRQQCVIGDVWKVFVDKLLQCSSIDKYLKGFIISWQVEKRLKPFSSINEWQRNIFLPSIKQVIVILIPNDKYKGVIADCVNYFISLNTVQECN